MLSAPPIAYTNPVSLPVPATRTRAKATALPLTPAASGLPGVHDTALGVNGTLGKLGVTLNGKGPLVPPEFCTATAPLNAPAGTVVTMY